MFVGLVGIIYGIVENNQSVSIVVTVIISLVWFILTKLENNKTISLESLNIK